MLNLRLLTRRLKFVACGVFLSATLAACGHSDESALSQFIGAVRSIINSPNADTAEPVDVSGVIPPITETDKPVTL
jgi:hypothetical protein